MSLIELVGEPTNVKNARQNQHELPIDQCESRDCAVPRKDRLMRFPFRQINHMSTLLSGVVFGEINWPIFPLRQFLIEGVVKAFIWINTECLIIKVEHQVTIIPNGGVAFGSYYSPRPIRHHQHG